MYQCIQCSKSIWYVFSLSIIIKLIQRMVLLSSGLILIPASQMKSRHLRFRAQGYPGYPTWLNWICFRTPDQLIATRCPSASANMENDLYRHAPPNRRRLIPTGRAMDTVLRGTALFRISSPLLPNAWRAPRPTVQAMDAITPYINSSSSSSGARAMTFGIDWVTMDLTVPVRQPSG